MAISGASTHKGAGAASRPGRGVPWPIWVAVLMLGLEGVGNLLAIPGEPANARWLAAKVLFVTGLIRGWRWVFVLFLAVAGMHVLGFAAQAPVVAGLNLVLVILVGLSSRHFFGPGSPQPGEPRKPRPAGAFDPDFDA